MISEEEFKDWLRHPGTIALRGWLAEQRIELMERWAEGQFSAAFDTEMVVKNAGATGACSAYQDIINLEYHQLVKEQDDDERKRIEALRKSSTDSGVRAGAEGSDDRGA